MTHCTYQEHWTQCHTLPAPSPISGEAKGPFPSCVPLRRFPHQRVRSRPLFLVGLLLSGLS
jgi:hypothetical protein